MMTWKRKVDNWSGQSFWLLQVGGFVQLKRGFEKGSYTLSIKEKEGWKKFSFQAETLPKAKSEARRFYSEFVQSKKGV